MPISKIKKNSLEANIIDEELVTADVITEQTDLGANVASGDTILVYDVSAGGLKKISQTNFLNFPTISSVSPTNLTSGDGTGNYTIVITGTGFSGASANLINDSGSAITFDTVTVDSSTQITGVVAKSSVPGSGEPYDVKVTAGSGLASTLEDQINVDQQPVFSTAAGSLGSIADSSRASGATFSVAAADPESGGDVTYTLESGSLPAGMSGSSTSSGYVISGTPDAQSSNTTSNFTIRAKDVNSNTSDRAFSLTVLAPVQQSFTSSGTFSVPSGVTTVNVLVVAGGGGGGSPLHPGFNGAGGGGAGGLIYRPAFPVTPGGTVTVTVGDGGARTTPSAHATNGQDSVFGTLTAKGGGGGGGNDCAGPPGTTALSGNPGGSGGGHKGNPGQTTPGQATQPTQPGDSGTYGFGNPGGELTTTGRGSGGGGAGAAGGDNAPNSAGVGGVGKAYTIADGTTSVYYAGGGGGGVNPAAPGQQGPGGQGGGGTGGNSNPVVTAQDGTANRGGGGGGGQSPDAPGTGGGGGGKGIVIVSY